MDEKELQAIEEMLIIAPEAPLKDYCRDLITALRAERKALEKATEFVIEYMEENHCYDEPCPNTHEGLCGEITWCNWREKVNSDCDICHTIASLFILFFPDTSPCDWCDEGICTYSAMECWPKYWREEK